MEILWWISRSNDQNSCVMSPMLIAPLSIEIQTILMKHTISSSSDWLSLARCSKLCIQRKPWNMVNSVQGLNFLLRVKRPSVRLSRQKYKIIPNHFPLYKAARSDPNPSPAITPLPHCTSQTFKPLQQRDRQRLPFFCFNGTCCCHWTCGKVFAGCRTMGFRKWYHPTEKMSCEL